LFKQIYHHHYYLYTPSRIREPFLLILTALCTGKKRQQTMPSRRAKFPETYLRTLNTSITSSFIVSGNCCVLDFRRGEHPGYRNTPNTWDLGF
jgi:hypothetical protein